MDVPDSLKERLALFQSSGRFFKHGAAELFAEESWVQVLIGQGLEMTPDPVTRFVPDEQIAAFLSDIEDVIADVADKMRDHGEFVWSLPPSTPAANRPAAPTVDFTLKYERGAQV
jgi:tryptophan halogenase